MKLASAVPLSGEVMGSSYADTWRTRRLPTDQDLLAHYKGDAFTCATINATACASVPMRLFVKTRPTDPQTKRKTAPVTRKTKGWLAANQGPAKWIKDAAGMEEVVDHPILSMFQTANEIMDGFTLMEATFAYLDILGRAYWQIERDAALGRPSAIWLLLPQMVTPIRDLQTGDVTEYQYGKNKRPFKPDEVILFTYPDLRDPYLSGRSPAAAVYEELCLLESDMSLANALLDNRGRPDMIFSPSARDGVMSEAEQKRMKISLQQMFSRARNGGIAVARTPVEVQDLGYKAKDLEAIKRRQETKLSVYNGFGVPISLVEGKDINRATLETALIQHARLAVLPRLTRLYQRLNQVFIAPTYGDRFYLWFDNPVIEDEASEAAVRKLDLDGGSRTINEVREEDGQAPVPWGEKPWLLGTLAQPSDDPTLNARREPVALSPFGPPAAGSGDGQTEPDTPPDGPPASGAGRSAPPQPAALWAILTTYHSGGMTRAATIDGLLAHGCTHAKAVTWTMPVIPTDDRPHCCHEKAAEGHPLPEGTGIRDACRRVFEQQRAKVVGSIQDSMKSAGWSVKDIVWEDIGLKEWDIILAEAVKKPVTAEYKRGADAIQARLDVGESLFDLEVFQVRDAINTATMRFAESTNVTTSLELGDALKTLRSELNEGIVEQGDALPELVKRVNGVFDRAEKVRAERIAVTESSRAMHAGEAIAAKNSGVVKGFQWLLGAEPCEVCQQIADSHPDGASINGTFGRAQDYGLRGGNGYDDIPYPPAHPYCMCTVTEIIDEEALQMPEEPEVVV